MDDDPELTPPAGGGTPPAPPDDQARRFAELERELAKVRAERDLYRESTNSLMTRFIPWEPFTEEELHDMLHGPRGQPIREYVAELERELGEAV